MSVVMTFSNDRLVPQQAPELALSQAVKLKASTTYVKGEVLGQIGSTQVYGPYDATHVDGTENAVGVLEYACSTDAGSLITVLGEWLITRKEAQMFVHGVFKTTDLSGLDAGALDDLQGKIIAGSVANGLVVF